MDALRPGGQAAPEGGREVAAARRRRPSSPVQIEDAPIATTFWGKAWCDNLERYSDFANRLPRGRTYVRNGSVVRPADRREAKVEPGLRLGAVPDRDR